MGKNLNYNGPKVQVKATELNTSFGGSDSKVNTATAKDSKIAFTIPLSFVKGGKVDIEKLVVNCDFSEEVAGTVYNSSVSLKDANAIITKLHEHMQDIATCLNKDARRTGSYTVAIGGADFGLVATERDAKQEEASRLMSLGKWVAREGDYLTAGSAKIPSYLYLLERPSVVFECRGHKVELSSRKAMLELMDYADNELQQGNVFDQLKSKIKTPMQVQSEKEAKMQDDIIKALDVEMKKVREEQEKVREKQEREELEKEVGWIKTEVISNAARYEALIHRLKDKVDLINSIKTKGYQAMLELRELMVAQDNDGAIMLAFGVASDELAFLKLCSENKNNLKWMVDNKGLFTKKDDEAAQ